MTDIHPTAVIDSAAIIADTAMIGPYCVIGPDVVIDDDVCLDVRRRRITPRGTTSRARIDLRGW